MKLSQEYGTLNLTFPRSHIIIRTDLLLYAHSVLSALLLLHQEIFSLLFSSLDQTFLNIKSANIYCEKYLKFEFKCEYIDCVWLCSYSTHHKVSIHIIHPSIRNICGCFGLVFILRVKIAHACIYFSTYKILRTKLLVNNTVNVCACVFECVKSRIVW